MLCALRIYLNTVIFQFYIIHACIRILCYIHLPAWSASRCHKYFLICCTFFMPFYKYSNTFDSTLFYIYVSLLYICIQYASRLFYYLLICYILVCFSISTVIQILLFSISRLDPRALFSSWRATSQLCKRAHLFIK